MERPVALYPWQIEWTTLIIIIGAGLFTVLALYLAMRSGRMERPNTETPGKPPIHEYAGLTRSDSNGVTIFVWLVIILLLIWAVGYVLYTAANGLGY